MLRTLTSAALPSPAQVPQFFLSLFPKIASGLLARHSRLRHREDVLMRAPGGMALAALMSTWRRDSGLTGSGFRPLRLWVVPEGRSCSIIENHAQVHHW